MLYLFTVLTPDLKKNINIYKLIIIINLGYYLINIIIILVHLQKTNIIKNWKFFNYHKKIVTAPPHLFGIGGEKNNFLFTLGTHKNINNK